MRNYPNGSKWKTKYQYVDNTEITVEQVLYDKPDDGASPNDLIIYRDHAAGTISCMRRSHADEYLEKVEPKWEVGVTYEPPGGARSGRNHIIIRFVFDDGSAAFETLGVTRVKGVKGPEFRKHWAVKKD